MRTKAEKKIDPRDRAIRIVRELATRYRVSDRFLKVTAPRIAEICAFDLPAREREALLGLAEKSFRLQAESEAILRESCEMVGYLRPRSREATVSRRRPQVAQTTVQRATRGAVLKKNRSFG